MSMETPRSDTTLSGATRDAPFASQRDPVVERAAASAHQAVDQVASKVSPAVERMRSVAQDSADTLQAKLDDLGALRTDWTESCRAYVRERPLAALGMAVLVGFLLSRMIRTS
jgi:ElaB/YqjD/DUF883 family membrane-anchored ribosome-binding protein